MDSLIFELEIRSVKRYLFHFHAIA